MKKIFALLLTGVLSVLLCMPALAAELPEEGIPLPTTAFDGAEYAPPETVMLADNTREVLLGSYTIQQYLNHGWMLTASESFGASDFPAGGAFLVITDMTTDGTNKDVRAGIAYFNWLGDKTFFAYTDVGLSDRVIFTVSKKPNENKAYYAGIYNDTGDKMYGSFSLYAIHTD